GRSAGGQVGTTARADSLERRRSSRRIFGRLGRPRAPDPGPPHCVTPHLLWLSRPEVFEQLLDKVRPFDPLQGTPPRAALENSLFPIHYPRPPHRSTPVAAFRIVHRFPL